MPDKQIELTEMQKKVISPIAKEGNDAEYGIRIMTSTARAANKRMWDTVHSWYPELPEGAALNTDTMIISYWELSKKSRKVSAKKDKEV